MAKTIFYSWQSDLPNKTNRTFIEDCLKIVIREVQETEIQNAERDEEISLDKDTQGETGIPPIVDTIFNKIKNCAVLVPDLTFVGKSENEKLLPNPNVLVEYGWALNELTHSRIVPIINEFYGEAKPENLPFDMRHLRRPVAYNLSPDAPPEEKSKVKENLIKVLKSKISPIIDKHEKVDDSVSKYVGFPFKNESSNFLESNEQFIIKPRVNLPDGKLIMPDGQKLFLRLIPEIPLEIIKSSKDAKELINSGGLKPFGEPDSWFCERNKYGAFAVAYKREKITSLTQFFIKGEFWGIDTVAINEDNVKNNYSLDFCVLPGVYIERLFFKTLNNYLDFINTYLSSIQHIKIIAGLTGINGYRMAASDYLNGSYDGIVYENEISYETIINPKNVEPLEELRPFYNKIWEECGLDRPDVDILR